MHRLALILVFLSFNLFSQSTIDSLSKALKYPELSRQQTRSILNLLAKEYAEQNPDTAFVIAGQAINMANDPGDSLSGQTYVAFSSAFSYQAQYDSSVAYAFKALSIAEQYDDKVTMIDALNNLGIDYLFQEIYDQSLKYFERSKDLSEEIGDTLRWGHTLNNIGLIHGYEARYDIELEHYQKAAALFLAIGEQEGYANTLLNAGTTYTTLKQFDQADSLFGLALVIYQKIGTNSGTQQTIQSLAESKIAQGEYDEAKQLVNKALTIIKAYNYQQDEIYSYELLTRIAEATGRYQEALEYHRRMTEVKEEVFDLERISQIDELQTRYETEKKEAEIERLSLENDLKEANLAKSRNAQLAIGIGALMTIVVLVVYFNLRNKKLHVEREAQQLQIEALQKRLIDLNASPVSMNMELDQLNKQLHNKLTEREYEVLSHSMEGKSNNEIGDLLYISGSTVKFHLRNIYNKLGVSNRKEAVEYVAKA